MKGYFKNTGGTMQMWFYIAGGLKNKGSAEHEIEVRTKIGSIIIKVVFSLIKGSYVP